MYRKILVRYGEMSLKGKNRTYFEDILIRNIRNALQGAGDYKITKTFGRIYVDCTEDNWQIIADKLSKVFGIVSMSPVLETSLELEAIEHAALALMQDNPKGSFKVAVRRSNKRFPFTSPEMNQRIGALVLRNFPELTVDVNQPDIQLNIEIRSEGTYLFNQVIPGSGGLPAGTSSKAFLLLSGGIDSPVAGYLSLKRGVDLEAVHFYSYPFTSERSKEKVIDLARILAGYTGKQKIKLWVVHFTEIQKAIQQANYPELNITVMRRMMLRVACQLAEREKALALVTGDSLGQVASQTMESLATINAVTNMPILRPLIGYDKQEIIDISRKIDTYDTSILPYEDCCTVFVPKNPAIRPTIEQALEAELHLDIQGLIDEAIEKTECLTVSNIIRPF